MLRPPPASAKKLTASSPALSRVKQRRADGLHAVDHRAHRDGPQNIISRRPAYGKVIAASLANSTGQASRAKITGIRLWIGAIIAFAAVMTMA